MNRYLLRIAYIGTHFRSFAKVDKNVTNETVQGALELSMECLKPLNPIKVVISSRTDAGVHALNSSVHIDLERGNGQTYDTILMAATLNRYLKKFDVPLRVNQVEIVPNTFHARFRIRSRTYMYRLAIFKGLEVVSRKSINYETYPIENTKRCYYRCSRDFDIEKVREASELLIGIHDFRTFMGSNKENRERHITYPIRRMNWIKIEPGRSSEIHKSLVPNQSDSMEYWNFYFNAKSFINRQVRRMMAALIAVGEGKISKRDIYEMLTIPSKHSWSLTPIPDYGLYLVDVEYAEKDKQFCLEPITETDYIEIKESL